MHFFDTFLCIGLETSGIFLVDLLVREFSSPGGWYQEMKHFLSKFYTKF